VKGVEARKSRRSKRRAAAEHVGLHPSHHRHGLDDAEPDRRPPIGRLIHRQDVAGEAEGDHQQERDDAQPVFRFALAMNIAEYGE
jgi:hypothetical protein